MNFTYYITLEYLSLLLFTLLLLVLRLILIIILSLTLIYLTQEADLDFVGDYVMFVLKGLIIVMINIIFLYKNISYKKLIFICVMPFFISLLLVYKTDIYTILCLTYSTNIILLENFNIKTVKVNILIHKILIPFKELFISFKDCLNTFIQQLSNFHTLGGKPESTKKPSFTPKTVNYMNNNNPVGPGGININNPVGTGEININNPNGPGRINNNNPVGPGGRDIINRTRPDYPIDERTVRQVFPKGQAHRDREAGYVAINAARNNFREALNNQWGFSTIDANDKQEMIRRLEPTIRDLKGKFDRKETITIANIGEIKHIFSLTTHNYQIPVDLKGLYNDQPAKRTGNVISPRVEEIPLLRTTIIRSFKRILTGINEGNQ